MAGQCASPSASAPASDGHGGLEGVDPVAGGLERLVTMGGGDGDDHLRARRGELPHAVHHPDGTDLGPADGELDGERGELGLGLLGVGLVGEAGDGAALGLGADGPGEEAGSVASSVDFLVQGEPDGAGEQNSFRRCS